MGPAAFASAAERWNQCTCQDTSGVFCPSGVRNSTCRCPRGVRTALSARLRTGLGCREKAVDDVVPACQGRQIAGRQDVRQRQIEDEVDVPLPPDVGDDMEEHAVRVASLPTPRLR